MTDRIDPKRAAELLRQQRWTNETDEAIEYAAALCERETAVQELVREVMFAKRRYGSAGHIRHLANRVREATPK